MRVTTKGDDMFLASRKKDSVPIKFLQQHPFLLQSCKLYLSFFEKTISSPWFSQDLHKIVAIGEGFLK